MDSAGWSRARRRAVAIASDRLRPLEALLPPQVLLGAVGTLLVCWPCCSAARRGSALLVQMDENGWRAMLRIRLIR